MHKNKLRSQALQKLEWKQTDRETRPNLLLSLLKRSINITSIPTNHRTVLWQLLQDSDRQLVLDSPKIWTRHCCQCSSHYLSLFLPLTQLTFRVQHNYKAYSYSSGNAASAMSWILTHYCKVLTTFTVPSGTVSVTPWLIDFPSKLHCLIITKIMWTLFYYILENCYQNTA